MALLSKSSAGNIFPIILCTHVSKRPVFRIRFYELFGSDNESKELSECISLELCQPILADHTVNSFRYLCISR